METIKSFTSLEQSRKLAEILPLESADMSWVSCDDGRQKYYQAENRKIILNYEKKHWIPCWSIASLLEQFPYELCDDDGNSAYLQINKEDDMYQLVYEDPHGDFDSIETDRYEHFVDACYEMVMRLKELNLL